MNDEIKDYDELEQAYKELKDCKEWWRNRFNAVQRDYEELKQENERLKWDKEQLNSLVNSCQEEIRKLKEENKKLKMRNDMLRKDIDSFINDNKVDYKSRLEKANEYLANEFNVEKICRQQLSLIKCKNKLEDILNGRSDE